MQSKRGDYIETQEIPPLCLWPLLKNHPGDHKILLFSSHSWIHANSVNLFCWRMGTYWMSAVISSILPFHAKYHSWVLSASASVFRNMMRKKDCCWEICALFLESDLLKNWLRKSRICYVNLPVDQNTRLLVSGGYSQLILNGFMSVSSRFVCPPSCPFLALSHMHMHKNTFGNLILFIHVSPSYMLKLLLIQSAYFASLDWTEQGCFSRSILSKRSNFSRPRDRSLYYDTVSYPRHWDNIWGWCISTSKAFPKVQKCRNWSFYQKKRGDKLPNWLFKKGKDFWGWQNKMLIFWGKLNP